MSLLLADIALPVPVDRVFTYQVPPDLAPLAQPGMRALVPFGRKHITGVIVSLPKTTQVKGLRPLKDILDSHPTFSEEMLKLTRWIADYYLVPWGEALRVATPQALSSQSKAVVSLVNTNAKPEAGRGASQQNRILQLLGTGPLTVTVLQKKTGVSGIRSTLREMERKGWVTVEEHVPGPRARVKTETAVRLRSDYQSLLSGLSKPLRGKQSLAVTTLEKAGSLVGSSELLRKAGISLSVVKSLASKGLVELTQREVMRQVQYDDEPIHSVTLNAAQVSALHAVKGALDSGHYKSFLLHGVTGSGKTEVYIEALRHSLGRGKSAIVLVPEISLTPQTVRRFRAHFKDQVAVMHSKMSSGERYDAWRMARDGKVQIVIGPRSAVFAPLKNLGLIVVDEEHEASYKQFDASPRYNARDVAIVRASLANAVVVLGSATPSVESYHNALQGKHVLLELPERVDSAQLPTVEIVDMTRERREVLAKIRSDLRAEGKDFPKQMPQSSISRLLESQIQTRIQKHEGVILLQNRRGFSHVVECFECGYVERCENCDVTMTFHSAKKHIRCHYCGAVKKPPVQCPSCKGTQIRFHAFGTQQVEQELRERFPESAVLRMDLDTTSRKGSHDKILKQFAQREADILLGTQMVAKGLDFGHVTLVGVISADTQMLLPDFRASERTFQLLTQVAGRAGRSTLAGEVVVQTMQPGHYSLKHVLTHDFRGFYKEELAYREELGYPPFSRIILVEFKSKAEDAVQKQAGLFAEFLREENSAKAYDVLGPADAAIPKIKNFFRKHVIVKVYRAKDPGGNLIR
ncbi:MAG: primosomal protein N', partial [Bacteroidota bacterium]